MGVVTESLTVNGSATTTGTETVSSLVVSSDATVGGNATVTGNVVVNGNTTIGNSTGDSFTVIAGTMLMSNIPAFRADLNGVSINTIPENATTLILCSHEVFDKSNQYNTGNGVWTPLPGRVCIMAKARTTNTGTAVFVSLNIFKNGVLVSAQYNEIIAAATIGLTTIFLDEANGTDGYDMRIQYGLNGTGNNNIAGDVSATYFSGFQVS